VTLYSALSQVLDAEVTVDTPAEVLRGYAHKNDVPLREVDRELSAGEITLELFEKLVEHTLVEPTFVCDTRSRFAR
jgi:lysyl-tRNA synthetase class 2